MGVRHPSAGLCPYLFATIFNPRTTKFHGGATLGIAPAYPSTGGPQRLPSHRHSRRRGGVRRPALRDGLAGLIEEIRQLSDGFTPPAGACPTFHAFYNGLYEFEQDLHRHIHLENNILFPRAVAREATGL
jgi:hypothetical protein